MFTNIANAVNNAVSDAYNDVQNQVKKNSAPWYQTLGNIASSLSPVMSFINPLLGGASSLLGGLFGQSSQQEQNEFELQLNRENNEHNYRIWQEQKAHDVNMFNMENQANIDMWNMNNAYNDPSAQVERLRNAGLNPSLMMGGNPTGVASSAPSSAHANSSQAPTMQAPNQMPAPGVVAGQQALQFLVGTAQSLNQLSQANSVNRNTSIDIPIKGLHYNTGKVGYENALVDYRSNILRYKKQEDDYNDWQFMRNDIILTTRATRQLAELSVKKQEILNKYLDANQQLELAKLASEISLNFANTNLSFAQREKVIAEKFESFARANNLNALTKYYDSQTRLNDQQFVFNYETESDRKEIVSNEADQSILRTETSKMDLVHLKTVFKDMVVAELSSLRLSSLQNIMDYNITEDSPFTRRAGYYLDPYKGLINFGVNVGLGNSKGGK